MKKYERYLDSLEQQVEEKYDDPSEQYKYFIDQPLSKGDQIKADKGEQIQQAVKRQSFGVSEIPLEALYNDSIDQIKQFEMNAGRDHAPIKISIRKNFTTDDSWNESVGQKLKATMKKLNLHTGKDKHDLSLINVRCDDYNLAKDHIYKE